MSKDPKRGYGEPGRANGSGSSTRPPWSQTDSSIWICMDVCVRVVNPRG